MKHRIHISLLLLLTTLFLSCASTERPAPAQTKSTAPAPKPQVIPNDSLTELMMLCEKDARNAGNVIIEEDMIRMLTHFKRATYNGRRYYLLEKENITRMIDAVTENIYDDYIIINQHGTILYTRNDTDIFWKNVVRQIQNRPYHVPFENRDQEIFISDVMERTEGSGSHVILISRRLGGNSTMPGLMVLQLDVSHIKEALNERMDLVGVDGRYRLDGPSSRTGFLSPLTYEEIAKVRSNTDNSFHKIHEFIYVKNFSYRTVQWLILYDSSPARKSAMR